MQTTSMINKKIIICSTVKNEAKNLKKFFKILEKINVGFQDYFIIFVDSDSTDGTQSIIQNYLLNKKGILLNEKIDNSSNRIKALEVSRNRYLRFIKSNEILSKFDYLIILDADGVNDHLNLKKIISALNYKENWTAIFSNQLIYYDIFALRIINLIEENFVKKIKDDFNNNIYKKMKSNISRNLTKFFFIGYKFNERFIKSKISIWRMWNLQIKSNTRVYVRQQ